MLVLMVAFTLPSLKEKPFKEATLLFEALGLIVKGTERAIVAKTVTYVFERLIEGANLLKC